MIEGITAFDAPAGTVNKGRFPLPEQFDAKRFVGKWVKSGPSIQMAQQSIPIASEGVVAQGWQVWKDKTNKPCLRTVQSGAFVLMFRPKVLQEAVNKLYGNQSRRRMIDEAKGNTVAGEERKDRGMLTSDVLDKIQGLSSEEKQSAFEGTVPFNDLNPSQAESPVEAKAEVEIKKKRTKQDWM